MKKLLLKTTFFILMAMMISCEKEDTPIPLSQETNITNIKLENTQLDTQIEETDNGITISITRKSPESIKLYVSLATGAKIAEATDGLTIVNDTTLNVKLQPNTFDFKVKAEDGISVQSYEISVVRDKKDKALELIEQVFLDDKTYIWNHQFDEQGHIIASQKINAQNNKNIKTYTHKTDEHGFIIKTSYTDSFHKKQTYRWFYENENLIKYNISLFEMLPDYFELIANENNKIEKIISKNQFDYTLGESTYKYDEKQRIKEIISAGFYNVQTFTYDEKDRIKSTEYSEYKYDDKGNIIEKKSRKTDGYFTKYTFNEAGLMLTETIYTENEIDEVYTYTYYNNNTLKEKYNNDRSRQTKYNEDGSYTFLVKGSTYSSTTHYNHEGLEIEYHSKNTWLNRTNTTDAVYEYNSNKQLSKETETVTSFSNETYTRTRKYKYDTNNQRTEIQNYLNTELESFVKEDYNQEGLMISSKTFDPNGELIEEVQCEYAAYGRISSEIELDIKHHYRREASYSFDKMGQTKKSHIKKYHNDQLAREKITDYHEGSRVEKRIEVIEYDNGTITRHFVITYDKDGEELSEDIIV